MADDQSEEAEKGDVPAWAQAKADKLILLFVGTDGKIGDLALFRAALAVALEEAYEDGATTGMLL